MAYITTVTEIFEKFLPAGVALSAEDYTVIADWEKRGIPIEVVRQALTNLFNKNSDVPNSVTGMEEEISAAFRDWLETN